MSYILTKTGENTVGWIDNMSTDNNTLALLKNEDNEVYWGATDNSDGGILVCGGEMSSSTSTQVIYKSNNTHENTVLTSLSTPKKNGTGTGVGSPNYGCAIFPNGWNSVYGSSTGYNKSILSYSQKTHVLTVRSVWSAPIINSYTTSFKDGAGGFAGGTMMFSTSSEDNLSCYFFDYLNKYQISINLGIYTNNSAAGSFLDGNAGVFGGNTSSGVTNKSYVLNNIVFNYSTITNLTTAAHSCMTFNFGDGGVAVAGGVDGSTYKSNTNYYSNSSYSVTAHSYSGVGAYAYTGTFGDGNCLAAGRYTGSYSSISYLFENNTHGLSFLASLNQSRSFGACENFNDGSVAVIGGYGYTFDAPTGSTLIYSNNTHIMTSSYSLIDSVMRLQASRFMSRKSRG